MTGTAAPEARVDQSGVESPPVGYSPLWDEPVGLGGAPLFFDRTGRAITLREFRTLSDDPDYVHVRRCQVGDWRVVCSWFGQDQRDLLERARDLYGPPLIFGVTRWHPETSYDWERHKYFSDEASAVEYFEELKALTPPD